MATLEIASRLRADGHDVAVFTLAAGRLAEEFRRAGSIPVLDLEESHALSAFAPDLIHAHDWTTVVSLEILGITAPWVLGFLGTTPPRESPPAVIGNARVAWWTQNHRVAENVQKVAGWMNTPVVVVGSWFDDQLVPRSQPTSITRISNVLLVSDHVPGEGTATLKWACASLGIAVTQVGLPDNPANIDVEMLRAFDCVVTIGRTALASMALGRPVLILGRHGSDGWVSSNDLDELARHNFSGRCTGMNPSSKALIHWLASPPGVEDRGRIQDWAFRCASLSVVLGKLRPLYSDASQSPPSEVFGKWCLSAGELLLWRASGVGLQQWLPALSRQAPTESAAHVNHRSGNVDATPANSPTLGLQTLKPRRPDSLIPNPRTVRRCHGEADYLSATQVWRESLGLDPAPRLLGIPQAELRWLPEVNDSSHPETPKLLDEVRVSGLGRFGNAVIQIENALALAESLAVSRVAVPPNDMLRSGAHELSSGVTLTVGGPSGSQAQCWLEGLFLFPQEFAQVAHSADPNSFDPHLLAGPLGGRDLRELRSLILVSDTESVGRNDVVIHVRTGDVFANAPHHAYGQPPLAFFLRAADLFPGSSIVVVAEDASNMVVQALLQALKDRDVRLQSGSLDQDVGLLLQARTLIASVGTFIPAIAGLSEVLENLISFERTIHAVGRPAFRSRVIRDVSGAYVAQCMSINWEANAEQLALMLSYEASNLGELTPSE